MSITFSGTSFSTDSILRNSEVNTAVLPVNTYTTLITPPNYTLTTTSGIDLKIKNKSKSESSDISPSLYFKYVKSKLTKIQKELLNSRLQKLTALLNYSEGTNQLALYEESVKKILEIIKEQEINVLGIDYYLTKDTIEKYIYEVKDKVIKFKQFSEFPRIIPMDVRKKLKTFQDKNIFDEYWIVYADYTTEKTELKSYKQKILDKDPILFGKFNIMPDNFYFIADWIDEYCDLTFTKLVDKVYKLDENFKIPIIETIDAAYITKLKQQILEKQQALKSTNVTNYKSLANSNLISKVNSNKKKSWFFNLFNK